MVSTTAQLECRVRLRLMREHGGGQLALPDAVAFTFVGRVAAEAIFLVPAWWLLEPGQASSFGVRIQIMGPDPLTGASRRSAGTDVPVAGIGPLP